VTPIWQHFSGLTVEPTAFRDVDLRRFTGEKTENAAQGFQWVSSFM